MSVIDEIGTADMDFAQDEFEDIEEQLVIGEESEAEIEAFAEQYDKDYKERSSSRGQTTIINERIGSRSPSRRQTTIINERIGSRSPSRGQTTIDERIGSRSPSANYNRRGRSRSRSKRSYRTHSQSSSKSYQSRSRSPSQDRTNHVGKGKGGFHGKGKGSFRGGGKGSYAGKGKGGRCYQSRGKGSYNKDSNQIRNVCAFFNTHTGCKNGSNCSYLHDVNQRAINNVHRCPNPNCTNLCIGKQCSVCHRLQKEAKYPTWKFKETSYMEKQSSLKMCPECNVNKCMGLRCRQCHFYCVQRND